MKFLLVEDDEDKLDNNLLIFVIELFRYFN